jgi:hypothetical protein
LQGINFSGSNLKLLWKKNFAGLTDLFLSAVIILVLVLLFYLTQKNYTLLIKSNRAVIQTSKVISGYQKCSADFKNAIIYITTYKNSPSQSYVLTYGKGLWEISLDMIHLRRLVSKAEQAKLKSISKQIYLEQDWLISVDKNNLLLHEECDKHIKSITAIQAFFDTRIFGLERQSVEDIKAAEHSLARLYHWIVALIISTSIIILYTLFLIRKQLARVKSQNAKLMEIAWMQSHKVRSQVAVMLGLGQLFNHDDPTDPENADVINYMIATCYKLDKIVREINKKTDAS